MIDRPFGWKGSCVFRSSSSPDSPQAHASMRWSLDTGAELLLSSGNCNSKSERGRGVTPEVEPKLRWARNRPWLCDHGVEDSWAGCCEDESVARRLRNSSRLRPGVRVSPPLPILLLLLPLLLLPFLFLFPFLILIKVYVCAQVCTGMHYCNLLYLPINHLPKPLPTLSLSRIRIHLRLYSTVE